MVLEMRFPQTPLLTSLVTELLKGVDAVPAILISSFAMPLITAEIEGDVALVVAKAHRSGWCVQVVGNRIPGQNMTVTKLWSVDRAVLGDHGQQQSPGQQRSAA